MANERLRTALLQRGLTPSELADTVGVDPKTIDHTTPASPPPAANSADAKARADS